MDREQALALLKQHLTNENHIKHSLAVEAIMQGLAEDKMLKNTDWLVSCMTLIMIPPVKSPSAILS
jgi:predicted hydrolase (HD superfamily)